MLEKLISYFVKRHLVTNFILFGVLVGGIFAWQHTGKEEMPSITFDRVHVSVSYPGAPAEDVEYFVTKPIEEELRGVDGVYRITSTSSVGHSNITIEIEQDYPDLDEALVEIRNAVLDVELPTEVIDDPDVRIFKTSKKAIIDVALINADQEILDVKSRQELQRYALALENQIISLPQVNSVDRRNYLQEEVQVKVYPDRLKRYEIPFNTVMRQIRINHVRKPAGTVETQREPKVTLFAELNSPEKLRHLVVQGGFEGQVIRLGDVADVDRGYEKNTTVYKVNGHEAVMFNVVKNSSYGILDSLNAVLSTVERFKKNNLTTSSIQIILLDDESIDLRNRLQLIGINGTIGFILILLTLFIFLNKRSGFWVAMGLPFTLCATMIIASLMGYTINGTTLAAVIIVLGMVVDDAIVVAENINRYMRQGLAKTDAVVKGTAFVFLPIVASILTTCVAFVPLFFFQGRFGRFIEFIPPIIFMMLGASLFESLFILPGHLSLEIPLFQPKPTVVKTAVRHWFENVEDKYEHFLKKVLPLRIMVFGGFIALLVIAGLIFATQMKFVMFPHEETRDIVLNGKTPEHSTRYETARMVRRIENIFIPYLGKEVVGFRTSIARSRRGGAVEENQFRMIIEIVPKEKRRKSADALVREFQQKAKVFSEFSELKFQKSRWGQDSGSPIEIIVQQNNDEERHAIVEMLQQAMTAYSALKNVEIDEGLRVPEYRVDIDQEKIKRLSIDPDDVSSTFRASLEGTVLYEFSNGDEDVRVRFTTVDQAKDNIEKVLDLPVENAQNYLVPLRNIVSVEEVESINAITRQDLKRTSFVFADINEKRRQTPLEIARYFEENIFPEISAQYPTAVLSFGGEIKDTRESTKDFQNAIIMVILLIYIILAVLFNSLFKPLIIMLAIPLALVGIILAFVVHGKFIFGFYAAIGAIGLAGVVINDSIIMLAKLDNDYDNSLGMDQANAQVARISKTRLRAVVLTTLTTLAGLLPTAYGFAGYDAMLAEMMLALTWGMIFGTLITLILVPCAYRSTKNLKWLRKSGKNHDK